ncbi:unnamed protein product, partial [Didymodactylos carnosus]
MNLTLDCYKILGVDVNASTKTIRQAYKEKVLKWHPDKRENDIEAGRMFTAIKKAYETLSDEGAKLAHDSKRDEDDDNDDYNIRRQELIQILHGKRISEMYEEKITKWIDEYPNYQFEDNFSSEIMKITNTILHTYEHERTIDCTRHICPVCDQYCHDLAEHMDAMQRIQNNHLRKISDSTSLNDLLASLTQDDWSWKPVEPSSPKYKELWFSPHWSSFEETIHQLLPSLNILKNVGLKTQPPIEYKKAEQIVRSICEDHPTIYNPDITFLTEKIDAELQLHRTGSKVISTTYSIGQQICIVQNPDQDGILSQVMFNIQSSPDATVEQSKCSFCSKHFGLFRKRYRCCMCSENQCNDCLSWQTCRPLGYTSPVRICRQCSSRTRSFIIDAVAQHIEQLLHNDINNRYLLIYIHLLKYYSPSNPIVDQLCKRPSDYYLSTKQFAKVIQCYRFMTISDQSLFKFAEILCSHSQYPLAVICFDLISKRFRYDERKWEQIGNDYWATGNAVLTLLSYEKANLNIEELWLRSLRGNKFLSEDRALFIFYTTWQKQISKQLTEWITWLTGQLQSESSMSAAISTLQLARFSAQQWSVTLNDFSNQHRYPIVASILRMLDEKLLNEILSTNQCTNNFLQLALQMLVNGRLENVDKSMMHTFSSSDIKQILSGLAAIHVFYHPDWQKLRNQRACSGKLDQAVSCAKVNFLLKAQSSTDFDWMEDSVEPNQSVFYLLESLIKNDDYIQLAESHAKINNYEVALNYYLLTLQSSPQLSAVETILSSANHFLPSSEAFRCYVAVYKQMRTNTACAAKTLESILGCFQAQKKPIIPALASALLAFEKLDHYTCNFYIYLLDELSKQYEENFPLINSIHHSMHNVSLSTQSLSQRMQNFDLVYQQFLQTTVYKQIKQVLYGNIIELAVCLQDVTNISALKQIQKEFFGNRDMSTMPGQYRAKMYLIECMIDKLENRHIDAVGKLNEALAVCPLDDIVTEILTIITNRSFHVGILKDLLHSIEVLGSDSSLQFVPLPLSVSFSKDNLLIISPNLRVVRKYERAILKRLNTNPLQAALSYIDLCQAVHDPTCIISNWTLACLHLYNLLSETSSIIGKEAEIYAYRNMISELVLQSFQLSRIYLPPHMQIYIFRLLLPILLQTTEIFRSSVVHRQSQSLFRLTKKEMVLSEQDSSVIQQLLHFTIHLTKVAPLIQLPNCLSFDLLYRELVGRRFLVRFLEAMIEQDIEQSYLYEYYLFEGVWQGWARDHDFNERRRACMRALLDTKDWDIYDVQSLLDIPLIPRTDDGWLYRDCRSLVFSGAQRFTRVDGIAFNKRSGQVQFHFQPVSKPRYGHDDALFDSVDVKEVFELGVTSAIFTLNQPDNEFHAHPFQEMLYAPNSLLDTQYLATLLHTDYLLKMFTTGTEVCAKPPFAMRPIDETFFQRLPKDLQDKLKLLHKCDRHFAFGRAHRFWIEANEMVYEEQETDSSTIFRVADVRLRVRKHLLVRNTEGKLVDDEIESEEEQHSAESLFAKAFTEHYNEIGRYFPELLRLKELLKLSALYVFAHAKHRSLSKTIDCNQLINYLTTVRNNISEYPHATNSAIDRYYYKTLWDNGVLLCEIPSAPENELRAKISQQLEAVDRQVVDQLTQNFCKQAHRRVTSDVKDLVRYWLNGYGNETRQLAQWLADGINDFHHQLKRPIEQLGIQLKDDDDESYTLKHKSGSCNWVPAVFLSVHGSDRRIYGGISLPLKLIKGHVPRNNATSTYNASTLLSNKSSTTSSRQ